MNTTIEELYNATTTIVVKFKEKELTYNVEMFDINAKVYGERFVPDCKISNFGYNHYFRTNIGTSNVKQYQSVDSLKRAIVLSAKSRGLTVEKFIIQNSK